MSVYFAKMYDNSLEAPDVTGSSLTLGTAGSRRTVYLIDENQKIPETNQTSSTSLQTAGAGSNSSSTATLSANNNNTAEPQTPTGSQKSDNNPATFLMYNRINNIVGGSSVVNDTPSSSSLANNRDIDGHQEDNKSARKRTEDKNNSIWYEYGCV